jgi:hypothetical protein
MTTSGNILQGTDVEVVTDGTSRGQGYTSRYDNGNRMTPEAILGDPMGNVETPGATESMQAQRGRPGITQFLQEIGQDKQEMGIQGSQGFQGHLLCGSDIDHWKSLLTRGSMAW